jgi:hypothetical protein
VEIGQTFLLQDKGTDSHLWVVISTPQQNPEEVVIVNLTSWDKLKDQSCVLGPEDHAWISHKTCVRYQDAKCVAESKLDELFAAGLLARHDDATDDLLRKVLLGAGTTEALPNKCRRVLIDQILIDE